MKLRVPFLENVKVLRGRKRTPEEAAWWNTADIEIAEVSATSAPVALRFEPGEGCHLYRRSADEMANVRWWGDALYSQPTSGEADAATFRALCESRSPANPLAQLSPREIENATERTDETDLREVLSYGTDHKVEQLRREAGKLLIVDGMVWRRCPEPAILLAGRLSDRKLIVDAPQLNAFTAELQFRLDEAALASERQDATPPRIEVLIPESLRLNFAERRLYEAANQILTERMVRKLADADIDYLAAYVRLRDATRAYGDKLTASQNGYMPKDSAGYPPGWQYVGPLEESADLVALLRAAAAQEDRLSGSLRADMTRLVDFAVKGLEGRLEPSPEPEIAAP